ncbi:hypothetical protein Mapa_010850 [Marchantia paleacea]|nr:hypothetical protein Mapa_010850 [Marchantia paleacea]
MGGVMKSMSTSAQREHKFDPAVADPMPVCDLQLGNTGFDDLPEFCIALIICFLTPRDIARSACTNRAFRDASLSDVVWQAKLPKCYTEVLAEAKDGSRAFDSKKQIFDFLCSKVPLHGHELFWLMRPSGEGCRSQGAEALRVVWGSDRRYWDWLKRGGSSYDKVAYLKAVCWLEVQGNMECSLPVGTYALSWRLALADIFDQAYGWDHWPVEFGMSVDDHHIAQTEHYLQHALFLSEDMSLDHPQQRGVDNDWKEFDVGDFTVQEGEKGSGIGRVKLQYSLIQIKGGHWKSGMFVDGVVIRPKQ